MLRHGFLKKLYTHTGFYTRGLVFATLSVAAAAINYVLYPITAHILSVEDFGEFSVLMNLITQIGGILIAFSVISLYFSSSSDEKTSRQIIAPIQKIILLIFISLTVLSILLSPFTAHYLHINNATYILIAMFTLMLSVPASFWTGYLQGAGEMQRVGLFSVSTASFKMILVVCLGAFLGLRGALWGVFIGTLLGLVAFWIMPGKKPPFIETLAFNKKELALAKSYLPLITIYCIAIIQLLIIQIFDITSVKVLFSATEAGNYAAVATISKVIFFVGSILIWIVLPEIAKQREPKRTSLVNKTYVLFLALTICYLGAIFILGANRTNSLLGSKFDASTALYLWSIVFQGAVLTVSFQTLVLLLIGAKKFTLLLGVAILALVVCLLTHSETMVSLLASYSLVVSTLAVILGIHIWSIRKYEKAVN